MIDPQLYRIVPANLVWLLRGRHGGTLARMRKLPIALTIAGRHALAGVAICLTSAATAQPAPQSDPQPLEQPAVRGAPQPAPATRAPGAATSVTGVESPAGGNAVIDQQRFPPLECYHLASGGGNASTGGAARRDAAYVCDLAVQMARDSGSAQALAAALTNRALVLAVEGRLEPALTDLEAAAQLTPEDAVVHGNRGNLLLRLMRPTEALGAHDRAVDLAPEDPETYYNRAFSYSALGEGLRAAQDVAAARALLERRRLPFTVPQTPAPDDRRSP